MRVDGALVALEVVAEHLFHQLHTRVHAARIAGKRGEQLELGGREVDFLALHENLVAGNVDREVAELEHFALRLGVGMHAAEQGAHARDKLAGAEGFHQVIVGAQLKPDDAVFHLALRGEHDDGHIGVVADGAADALAGNAWEHKVENDQVEMMLLEFLKRLLAVAHGGYPVVFALEISSDRIADRLFVFYKKNASGFVVH